MNTMNIPGFTAEASFYRSSVLYQESGLQTALNQEEEGIQPALPAFGCREFHSMKGTMFCCWAFGSIHCDRWL